MKFRTGLILGATLGYAAAQWLRRDDPVIATEPGTSSGGPGSGLRLMGDQTRKLAVRAQAAGFDALQRARGNIQSRLAEDGDANWN